MISLYAVLMLVTAHWVADFICQTDWMAVNKSTSWYALTVHVMAYTAMLGVFVFALNMNISPSVQFASFSLSWLAVNGVLHFITDAITSRVTSYLWKKEERHWFFVVIGFDQLIHMYCLFITYSLMS